MPRQEPETIKVTRAAYQSGDGAWKTCDVIENVGRRWLVGRWLQTAVRGVAKPERIVLMDGLEFRDSGPANFKLPVDWTILTTMPDAIFAVGAPGFDSFYVVDHPNIPVKVSR